MKKRSGDNKVKGLRSPCQGAKAFRDRITSRLDGRGGLGGDMTIMLVPETCSSAEAKKSTWLEKNHIIMFPNDFLEGIDQI